MTKLTTGAHYINFAQLERYSPKVRASLIRRYHALYTQKYRWFVRSINDRSFYCDGNMPDLHGVEIFDCDWTPEQWQTLPYRHFYNPVQDAWYANYANFGYPALSEYGYGYTRRDYLVTKNGEAWRYFYHDNDGAWVWWFPDDKTLKVVINGFYTTAYLDGTFAQGTFSNQEAVKNVNTSPIMTVAKRMNAKKYKGAFDPILDRLIEVYGLNRTQI